MIKLLIMDVDGTLTDGGIYYDDSGHEMKKFNVKDGAGITKLKKYGVKTMILTGRKSDCVAKRSEELKIDYVFQGIENKAEYLKKFIEDNNLDSNAIAYIGDDINDIECMQYATFTACPLDAVDQVKNNVWVVCEKKGGEGAVREFIDFMESECMFFKKIRDEKNAWYTKNKLRAHACGGIDGVAYTNSWEALNQSYQKGIKVIELDMTVTSDARVVISHNFMPEISGKFDTETPTFDEFMNYSIAGKYTPMSLQMLLEFMEKHPDVYIVVDHPAKGFNRLVEIITYMLKVIDSKKINNRVLKQFIIQVFTVREYDWLNSLGEFKNIEFYFSARRDIEGTIEFISNNNVHTVSINKVRLNKEIVSKFSRIGVRVFSPSINSIEEVKSAFEMGLWGVTSDFLDNEQLDNIIGGN